MFAFTKDITLVSHIPKKPDMIIDYNGTKGGVDTLDKMCAAYNCSRNTRRWPMVLFYSLLNVAGVNALVLYYHQNPDQQLPRRKFLSSLASRLAENHQRVRAIQSTIPKTITLRLKEILNISQPEPVHDRQNMRGRCAYCDRKKNRLTRYSCKTCGKFMCLEHASFICSECNVK
nr:unnamed protein product [Callosobruchus analis]